MIGAGCGMKTTEWLPRSSRAEGAGVQMITVSRLPFPPADGMIGGTP